MTKRIWPNLCAATLRLRTNGRIAQILAGHPRLFIATSLRVSSAASPYESRSTTEQSSASVKSAEPSRIPQATLIRHVLPTFAGQPVSTIRWATRHPASGNTFVSSKNRSLMVQSIQC